MTEIAPTEGLSSSTAPADPAWQTCQRLLDRFRTRVYANPGRVPPALCDEALASVERLLATSPERRAAAAGNLWQDALALLSHAPDHDVGAAADAATALLLAGHAARSACVCATATAPAVFSSSPREAAEVQDRLRLLSVQCVSASECREALPASWAAAAATVLDEAWRVVGVAEKPERSAVAGAVEVLAWSLDCLYALSSTAGERVALLALKPKLPQWLQPSLFESRDAAAATGSTPTQPLERLPPRRLLEVAERAERDGDAATLDRLLRCAEAHEERCRGYVIFRLPARIAELLVRRFPHHPSTAAAVATLGTALPCAALQPYGATRDGFEEAVAVLIRMAGPEPYFALQAILRHQPPAAAAAVQERYGDVLTGQRTLNWSTALAFTMRQVAAADPHWRAYVPETLRLLSDAGHTRQLWRLLPEYNAAEATANIPVAASVGRAVRQSGRWWHALEVLDLLAGAPAPRSDTEERLAAAACADTLTALLQAQQWQEALRMFDAVGAALLPPTESAVVARLLTALPSAAPWSYALATADARGLAPPLTKATLRCLHTAGTSPLDFLPTAPQQRAAAVAFAQHGRWDLVHALVRHRPTDVWLWRLLVQALERCCEVVDAATAARLVPAPLPPPCLDDEALLGSVAHLCLQRGWFELLTTHLSTLPGSGRASEATPLSRLRLEYEHLLAFAQTGRGPPVGFVFTDSYVIHHFVSCVARRRVSVLAGLPATHAGSKRRASAFLRVPQENLSLPRSSGKRDGGSGAATVRVVSAAAAPHRLEHCVGVAAGGLLVGYKVPAVSVFAEARGMLKALGCDGAYVLAYHLSAAASGLYLLCPASGGLAAAALSVRLRLHVRIAVLAGAAPVPLLAAAFFSRHAMRWRGGDGDCHEVEAVVDAEGGSKVRQAWRSLKADLNAEGWGPVEPEAGAGDAYHVVEVRVADRDGSSVHAGEVAVFTCDERRLRSADAGDVDAAEWEP